MELRGLEFNLCDLCASSVELCVTKKQTELKPGFIILILTFSVRIFCQETKLSETIVSIAEDLAASEADQEAASAYIDRLYELAENPADLNSTDQNEISRLFFLTDFQIKALSDYSRTNGRIISFNELAYIPGFDKSTAEMIIPFASITGTETTIPDSVRIRHLLITNLSYKTGGDDSASLGSALKMLTKYKFLAGSFTGGLTFEKDQGEKFFSPGTMSPDFISANIAYTGKGAGKTGNSWRLLRKIRTGPKLKYRNKHRPFPYLTRVYVGNQ